MRYKRRTFMRDSQRQGLALRNRFTIDRALRMSGLPSSAARSLSFHQKNLIGVVDFIQLHLNHLIHRGLHGGTDEGSFNRELTMTAIDQDEQLNLAWPSSGEESLHRRANRSP